MSLPKGAVRKPLNRQEMMKVPFVMLQAHPDDYHRMLQESQKQDVQQESILSQVFFSTENLELVQKQIIMEVFRRTNGEYLIERQNDADLRIVMLAIYNQHAKDLSTNIKGQILELDNLVVDEVVPGIINEVITYMGYLDRAFGPRQIMDHPQNVSNTGLKTLPSVTKRI